MSSTRNRNTPGDYALEQKEMVKQYAYNGYKHSAYGSAMTTNFAGHGLLMGRMPAEKLSENSCDIESQLFGIGSTNLVTPKAPVVPRILPVESLCMIRRLPVVLPEPLLVQENQRPYPMR
jgi:hypothetical protein